MKRFLPLLLLALALAPSVASATAIPMPATQTGGVYRPAQGVVVLDPSGAATYAGFTAYTAGAVADMRVYDIVYLFCTVAPSAGTGSLSPDNNSDFIAQTAVLNNATGITTTTTVTSTGMYSFAGHHQWFQASLTGGTCFIAGGQ